jgi:predicted ribosomally synthesized peptide with nif11-like leader
MRLFTFQHLQAMSEEQLAALLAKLKDDAGLQAKLTGAADLDAAVALAKEAGFDVSKADWLKYQATQTLELSDEELEGVAGGMRINPVTHELGDCPVIPFEPSARRLM